MRYNNKFRTASALLMAILMLVIGMAASLGVSANAGPVIFNGAEGAGIITGKDSHISVLHEDLSIDLSGVSSEKTDGKVVAEYTMKNNSESKQTVLMAFPYIGRMTDADRGFEAYVDGTKLHVATFFGRELTSSAEFSGPDAYGNTVKYIEIPNLELSDIVDHVLLEDHDAEPERGSVYTFSIRDGNLMSQRYDDVYVRIELESDLLCYTYGFDGYTVEGEKVFVTAKLDAAGERLAHIFVPDDAIEFSPTLKVYSDAECKNEINDAMINFLTNEKKKFSDFILSINPEMITAEYWSLISEYVSKNTNAPYMLDRAISAIPSAQRLVLKIYEVEFEAGAERKVKVNCHLDGAMSKPSAYSEEGAVFNYTYLSNPAKNWASFGTLTVSINAGDKELSSSIEGLAKGENGIYTAELQGLPDKNMTFTLGTPVDSERIEALRNEAKWKDLVGLIIPRLWIIIPVLLAASAIVILLVIRRRKAANK